MTQKSSGTVRIKTSEEDLCFEAPPFMGWHEVESSKIDDVLPVIEHWNLWRCLATPWLHVSSNDNIIWTRQSYLFTSAFLLSNSDISLLQLDSYDAVSKQL